MTCPKCETENPSGAKFCMGCGSGLTLRCGNCAAELPAQAKFCLECGTPVATAPAPKASSEQAKAGSGDELSATFEARLEQYIPKQLLKKLESARSGGGMRGERRIVTMLFCDVKGSTAAAEKLDPEEWADIMNGAFEHLIAPVYRYEGTLARLMGDAILAFFGAPIAHEDDPQRAILAGLAIVHEIEAYKQQVKRRWGIDFDVRVGINTGLVVVGEVGTDMRLEYTAMGDAVNLAARMEQSAGPGTVLISADTHKLVAPLYDFQERADIAVKGKAEPVTAYRVTGVKAKPGRLRGIEGLDSPMIGRERELAALRGAVDAVRRGSGQIVSVMAEAGLGKSRLVRELRAQLESEGIDSELEWLDGRALSFQTQTPNAPFVDLFARALELIPDDTPEAQLATVAGALQAGYPERAAELAPLFASLLGIPLEGDQAEKIRYLEPPALRKAIHQAVVQLIGHKAATRPVVLVLEDLHWADSSSLELTEALMTSSERSMLMLVNIFRPRRQEPSWKLHEVASRDFAHCYLELPLEPLSADRSRELVQNLLWVEGLPESLRQLIVDKCDGNPFFVEEVVRSLIDAGLVVQEGDHWRATAAIETLKVPDTLAGVLTTRLDGLGDTPKRVAQTAAVLGRELDFDLLASIYEPFDALNDALRELQRRGILREKSRLPKRVLEFKHALTREAAYDSMLLKTRRELHKKTAQVLQRVAPERVGDIANHYLDARENAVALPWIVKAGERAAKAYATPEAINWFDKALSILETSPDVELARQVYEARGNALQLVMRVPETLQNYEAMRAVGEQSGDGSMVASALNKAAMVRLMMMGEMEEAVKLLEQAESAAEGASCKAGLAEGSMIRCNIHTAQAQFDTAYHYLDRAAKLGAELQAEEPLLYGLVHICNTLIYMTEYDRAWEKVMEASALAREKGNLKWLSEIQTFSEPACMIRNGDVAGAIATLAEGLELAHRIGHWSASAAGYTVSGQLSTLTGDFERAIECNERAVAAANQSQMPFFHSWALCTMGTTYLQLSEKLHDAALKAHDAALKIMAAPFGNVLGAMNWCELGFCCIEFGKLDDALELFNRGLTEPTPPMRMVKPQLHMGAAFVHLQRDELKDARRHADEARTFAEERKMQQFYPFLSMVDASIARAAGELERAMERLNEVERHAEALGFRPVRWQAHAQAAQVLEQLGRNDEAKARRQLGCDIANEITAGFKDPALQGMYNERACSVLGVTTLAPSQRTATETSPG